MKKLKRMLFSTVLLIGTYESSASVSSIIEECFNKSGETPRMFLRTLQSRVDSSLFGRFQSVLGHGQSAPQQMAALKGVLDRLKAEEAQSRLASAVHLAPPAPEPLEEVLPMTSRPADLGGPAELILTEALATSVSRAIVMTNPSRDRGEMPEDLLPPTIARERPSEDLGASRRTSTRSVPVADPEAEALKLAHLSRRLQILDLERHYGDLSREYRASLAAFQDHQRQEAPLQAALRAFPQRIEERRAVLLPLLQEEEEWRKEVRDAYGTWGIALLNGEDTDRQMQELETAMQEIYRTTDLEAQEHPRQVMDSILASPNNSEKQQPCPLPDLFRKRRLLEFYRESVEGKPPFSTTLQTPEIQRRFGIVGAVLPTIVEFNQVLFEHLAPAHLDFENVTAKSSAVAKAKDERLEAFLRADNVEERKRALQKKNYSGPLSRVIDGLKRASSDLATARAQRNSESIRSAMEKLTSAGLSPDVLKGDEDAINLVIDNRCDDALAEIALEVFKETALSKIYDSTMRSLEDQWRLAEKERQEWIVEGRVKGSGTREASVKEILSQKAQSIQEVQSQIQGLEAEEVRVREALSRLWESLTQEDQMLQQRKQEGEVVGRQLEDLRRQNDEVAVRLEARIQGRTGAQ